MPTATLAPAEIDYSVLTPEDIELALALLPAEKQKEYAECVARYEKSKSPYSEELAKCAADPCYFIATYCPSFDPRIIGDSFGKFIPSALQESVIRDLQWCDANKKGSLIEKSRDSGATFIAAFYSLWCWLFLKGDITGFGSRKFDLVDSLGDPGSIFEKIRMTFRALPDWMISAQCPNFIWSKHSTVGKFVNPDRINTIVGEGGDNIGRGARYSRYFVDEASHLEHPKLIGNALSQSTKVRHDISTPNGLDEFYIKRQSGLVKVIRMHWIDDPRKWKWVARNHAGQVVAEGEGRHPSVPLPNAYEVPKADRNGITVTWPWYEGPDARLHPDYTDPASLAQEVDIDYIGSGRPKFNRRWLIEFREYMYPNNKYRKDWEPIREENDLWGGKVTTFADPIPGMKYALLVDTAKGLAENGTADYSVAHIFDLQECEQVLHYRGQPDPMEYAMDLYALGTMYNNAIMVVETPGPGEAVLSMLATQKTPYPNIYSYWDDDLIPSGMLTQKRYGMPMTTITKPEGDAKLQSMIEDAAKGFPHSIAIRHPNTIEECIHYVRLRRDTCGAEAGAHDDEVACLRLLAMIWPRYTTRGKDMIRNLRPIEPITATGCENMVSAGFDAWGAGGGFGGRW